MPPQWSWPDEASASTTGADVRDTPASPASARPSAATQPDGNPPPPRNRHYKPRTCRICLEAVEPTFEDDGGVAASFFNRGPQVKYVSSDPSDGRLISPCKCKGTQKYVHEGCLRAWRQSQPLSERNFWKCPTCGFEYRMERLRWARWISSRTTKAALTLVAFAVTVFLLGFIGDPILNLWFDPMGTLKETVLGAADPSETLDDEPDSWFTTFLRAFSPWACWVS